MNGLPELEERPLLLARSYRAAPSQLWRLWTDPDAIRQWWNQAASPGWIGEIDLRVGGRCRFVLRGRDGGYEDVRGVYFVGAPELKLAFTWALHGVPESACRITVLFNMLPDRGTKLVFTREGAPGEDALDWEEALGRLGRLV